MVGDPMPPLPLVIVGSVLGIVLVHGVWIHFTSAKSCVLEDPFGCLLNPAEADPWALQVAVCTSSAVAIWTYSLGKGATKECDPSIIDRLLSIEPVIYSWHAYWGYGRKRRAFAMAGLVSVWGARLTYNCAIKGRYSGVVDYRWGEIRRSFGGGWRFNIAFNLIFICCYQQTLILAFTAPVVASAQNDDNLSFDLVDTCLAAVCLILVGVEAVADAQRYKYQREKHRRLMSGESLGPYERGFVETGLWSFSRHPNYVCEVGFWWVVFALGARGGAGTWTILGPILLTLLFVAPGASIDFCEALSSRKYPSYSAEYMKTVPRFLPFKLRGLYLCYFVTHVPITALMDAQAVLPRELFPSFAIAMYDWHVETHQDILLANPPAWFRSLIVCELLFQLPFFLYATRVLYYCIDLAVVPPFAKRLFVVYGAHVATTLVPIFSTFYASPSLTSRQCAVLSLLYAPYFMVPVALICTFISSDLPTMEAKPKGRAKAS